MAKKTIKIQVPEGEKISQNKIAESNHRIGKNMKDVVRKYKKNSVLSQRRAAQLIVK